MNTISEVIDDFIKFLRSSKYEEAQEMGHNWISNPLNDKKATEASILKKEDELGIGLPVELRQYYLNDSNGTEINQHEYAFSEARFEVFSYQKIFGIVDYSSLYWKGMLNPFEYNSSGNTKLSDVEKDFLKKSNTEYFVCSAAWTENFIDTFVFDKKHNFYRFVFDQDVTISEYIHGMRDGSNEVVKDRSLIKVLSTFIDDIKSYYPEA